MKEKEFSVLIHRSFLRKAACAALGTGALSSAIGDLRIINSAMAQTAVNDYKALVCVFLSGGNDSNNLIIPTIQSGWYVYAALRGDALARPISGAPNVAIPLPSLNSDGHEYGIHPACPELATLFNENKLAVLFNAGTLVHPLTRAQYQRGAFQKPPQL